MSTTDGGSVAVESQATATIVRVLGELDYVNADQLDEAIVRDGMSRECAVVVDFSACRYIDSAVLTVLVRAKKRLGDNLRLVVPTGSQVRRILTITNLDRALHIEPTLEDALNPAG